MSNSCLLISGSQVRALVRPPNIEAISVTWAEARRGFWQTPGLRVHTVSSYLALPERAHLTGARPGGCRRCRTCSPNRMVQRRRADRAGQGVRIRPGEIAATGLAPRPLPRRQLVATGPVVSRALCAARLGGWCGGGSLVRPIGTQSAAAGGDTSSGNCASLGFGTGCASCATITNVMTIIITCSAFWASDPGRLSAGGFAPSRSAAADGATTSRPAP